MLSEKTQARFLDYLIDYTTTIGMHGEELQKLAKKKRSGEARVNGAKHIYFGAPNGITIMNKKTSLEMNFTYHFEDDFIFFLRSNLYSYIESDLNASGLGKDFPANNTAREADYDECMRLLCMSGRVRKREKGYAISKEELFY